MNTSALDQETEIQIMDSIYNLVINEGISIVAISHKKSILSRFTRIYKIVNGKLILVKNKNKIIFNFFLLIKSKT